MKPRVCLTELRTWDAQGRLAGVELCRAEMRLSMAGAHGPAARWFHVCRNERCGTALSLTDQECRDVMASDEPTSA